MRAVTADGARGQGRAAAAFRRASLTAVLAILVGWVGTASLEGSDFRLTPPVQHVGPPPASSKLTLKAPDVKKQKATRVAEEAKKDDKVRVAFSMDSKPWPSVFKWLAETTGKEVINQHKPPGTFTFVRD